MLLYETGTQRLEYPDISDPFFVGLIPRINPHTLTLHSGVEAPWALYRAIQ